MTDTKDLQELEKEIDILLLRMEQTDPYHSRRKAILALFQTQLNNTLKDLIEQVDKVKDSREFPGIEPGQDPVRETCYKQGNNEALNQVKELISSRIK